MSEQSTPHTSQMGRPSKYTPQTIGKVLGSLQAGLSVESACDHAGIHPDIHYQWVKDYDEYSEKVTAARLYGKLLASKQVTDILQDVTREKPKYSETTRATKSRWYLEKHEKQIYGSQSMLAAKVESDSKGGVTTTIVHATDGTFTDLVLLCGKA
jgi:Transposase